MTPPADVQPATRKTARFSIREATETDIPAIYELYREVEPEHQISLEDYSSWWRWLFIWNPAGRGLALGGFQDDGACVGHVAVAPFAFRIDGRNVTAGFPCKLMVAESHRKSLLYPSLVRRLLKSYPDHGMEVCLAPITRPRVLEANLALGFKKSATLNVLARPLRAVPLARELMPRMLKPLAAAAAMLDPLLRPRWGLLGPSGIAVQETTTFNHLDELFARLEGARQSVAPRRSGALLEWRFDPRLHRGYRVLVASKAGRAVGYAAIRPMPMLSFQAMGIVDMDWDPATPEAGHALLSEIHRQGVAAKVDLIAALASPGARCGKLLRQAGYLKTPASFTWVFHGTLPGGASLAERPPEAWADGWIAHDFV